MLFYLSLIAVLPFLITAFPQNLDSSIAQVNDFVFDGPVASEQSEEQKIISTSTTTVASSTLSEQYNTCLGTCPITNEYNPVCGTDNVDYTNPGGLGCAQHCGKVVKLNYYGRCSTGRTG